MRDTIASDMAKNQYHHGNLRQALIEAAADQVVEFGADRLSLRAVARRAGVSQAAPYHHFKDKEALLAEVCRMGFEDLRTRSEASIVGLPDAPAKLRALGIEYVRFARERNAFFRVMFGGYIKDKECYPELKSSAECSFELLTEVLMQGQREGSLDVNFPPKDALVCWAAVHGAACLIVDGALPEDKMEMAGIDADSMIESVVDRLQRGLAPGVGVLTS